MSQAVVSEPGPQEPAKKTSLVRVVLFVILGLLVSCLAYDQLVARPAVNAAQDLLEQKIMAQNAAPGETAIVTPEEVHRLIGRDSVAGIQKYNGYQYEEFRWLAGLPMRQYNVIVIYQGAEKPRLSAVGSNKKIEAFVSELHAPDQEGMAAAPPPVGPADLPNPGAVDAAAKEQAKKTSGEKTSGEKTSGEKTSGEKTSGEKESGEKPADEKASGEKASGEKTSAEKAAEEKPAGEKAADEKAAEEKPSGEKPAAETPPAPAPTEGKNENVPGPATDPPPADK